MQYKAEIKHYQYFDFVLPDFNEVLMTTQNVRIYDPVNIMLI